MAISVSIPLDVIYEIVQRLGEVEDYNTLASMSLTCRAVAPLSRARLFYSIQFLPGADEDFELELSRLRRLDDLFTSNPMLPTYVRIFEFGNIESKVLWFTGGPLARVLNSLTQLKIFLITGPYPNMDWDEFDEEMKMACIRASARPTLENLEVAGIMNLPTAFITEAVQIAWLYLVDAQMVVGDPAPFARSEPQPRRDLKTLIYQSCDGTPRLLLQQISQPSCRFDLSTLQRFEIISGSADELMVAWSIAALAKGSLRKLVIPTPEIDPCIPLPLDVIREIGTFSELRNLHIAVEFADFCRLLKNVTFPKLENAGITIHLRSEEYQKEAHETLAIDTRLVMEVDDRLLIAMPCLRTIQFYFCTGFRRTPGPDDDIKGLFERFQQQLLGLFPTLYESRVVVQCSLSNAYVDF